jgi:hypothetical protein
VASIHPRPLTVDEERVLQHLLEAWPGGEPFLRQLEDLRVLGRCDCGCVTVYMEGERGSATDEPGRPLPVEGSLSAESGEPTGGVLILTRDGRISALEAYSTGVPAILSWPLNDRIFVQVPHK